MESFILIVYHDSSAHPLNFEFFYSLSSNFLSNCWDWQVEKSTYPIDSSSYLYFVDLSISKTFVLRFPQNKRRKNAFTAVANFP